MRIWKERIEGGVLGRNTPILRWNKNNISDILWTFLTHARLEEIKNFVRISLSFQITLIGVRHLLLNFLVTVSPGTGFNLTRHRTTVSGFITFYQLIQILIILLLTKEICKSSFFFLIDNVRVGHGREWVLLKGLPCCLSSITSISSNSERSGYLRWLTFGDLLLVSLSIVTDCPRE